VKRWLLFALLLWLVVLPTETQAQVTALDRKIKSQEKRLKNLRREIQRLTKDLKRRKASEAMTLKTLNELDHQISLLKKYQQELRRERQLKQAQIQVLESSISAKEQKIDLLRRRYARRVRRAYKWGHERDWELILLARNLNEAARRALYLRAVSRAEGREVARLKTLIRQTRQERDKVDQRLEEIQQSLEEEVRNSRLLKRKQRQKKKELARLRRDRQALENQLKQKKAAIRKVKNLIAGLEKEKKQRLAELARRRKVTEREAAAAFARNRGRLPWPTLGRVVERFGPHRNKRLGTVTDNPGIDIAAPQGTPVKAVMDGIVTTITWLPGFGNTVILDHGNGYYTVYAHLDEMLVEVDDFIKTGEQLGTVGDSGSLEGARLHFEIWQQQKKLNPLLWLKRR